MNTNINDKGNGALWVIVALLAIIIIGGAWYMLSARTGYENTQYTYTPPPATNGYTEAPLPTRTATISPFIGYWNGKFVAQVSGCPGGNVSFTVTNNGTFQGPATTNTGNVYYGGGSVTSSGTMKGTWHIGTGTVTFNGRLSGNAGSGSYADGSGCYGSFSVAR